MLLGIKFHPFYFYKVDEKFYFVVLLTYFAIKIFNSKL